MEVLERSWVPVIRSVKVARWIAYESDAWFSTKCKNHAPDCGSTLGNTRIKSEAHCQSRNESSTCLFSSAMLILPKERLEIRYRITLLADLGRDNSSASSRFDISVG